MTKPCQSDEELAAYYAIVRTWLLPPGVSVVVPRWRKQMYRKLSALGRHRSEVYFTIFDELKRERAGSERGETIAKAVDALTEAWLDAQLGIDPPVPQTPLEELLQEHHRLQWAEWNLCDEIEKRDGAVSPLYDSRPDSVPRPCPY
jgi:hypothetical protein